jgi:Domain of unknown function (DUF4258)
MQFDLITISSKFREGEHAIHPHADDEMQNDDVPIDFLVEAIGRDSPKIIEKYHYSCLILGWGSPGEPIHAVVALGTLNKEYDTPLLITVYRPDRDPQKRWKENYAKRKKKFLGRLF